MKAIVYTKYGPPDVLQLKEVEKPVPRDNEVLIKIHAASVNSWDWDLLRGRPFLVRMWGLLKPKYKILGADVAGRVEAFGRNAKQFQLGEEVFGDLCECGWGGFAEYVCARENALALKPAGITFEQAAAVPQAAVMVLQGLRDKGNIQSGQNVLINGAGGAVGTNAVQLAKHFGAIVTGVCSSTNLELVKSLGADSVIDYTRDDFTKNTETYDVIFDTVAKIPSSRAKKALKKAGIYLNVLTHSGSGENIEDLIFLKKLIEDGMIKPIIDKCYSLEQIVEAHRYVEKGHKKGNVVITLVHNNKT